MDSPRPGVAFRETMSGPFALGATDPKTGQATGASTGSMLALHSNVHIPDIERFLVDVDHPGNITGTVDFTPFGEGMPTTRGRICLFSPGGTPALKRMIYEVAFRHEQEDYFLRGQKDVRDDPGFDLWSDTTTLLTRLHKSEDDQGPIIGAGILSLDVSGLIRLVSTIRATDVDSLSERVKAVTAFGRFFLGELWDTYAHHASREQD